MTFGAGFYAPLGAIVLGGLPVNTDGAPTPSDVDLMSSEFFSIACMPGYSTIGLLPVVVLSAVYFRIPRAWNWRRVVYLSEIATPATRVSSQLAIGSQQVASCSQHWLALC